MSTTKATPNHEASKAERWADRLRIEMAQDLREISHLFLDLHAEAANKHDDKDMPGGIAMVLLSPSADPEAWGYAQMSALMGRTLGHGLDELDDDPAPPLLVLAGWTDIVRSERKQPTDLRATISREVDYLRKSLDWMLSTDEDGDWVFLEVDALATSLRTVRACLESVLHDGVRTTLGAPCLHCRTPLIHIEDDRKGLQDEYKCPGCYRRYGKTHYDYAVGVTYLHNAPDLTAAQIELRLGVTAGRVRVWGVRYPEIKAGKSPEGLLLYKVSEVEDRLEAEKERAVQNAG